MITFLPEHYLLTSILFLLSFGIVYGLSANLKFPFLYKNTLYLSVLIIINFIFYNIEDLIFNTIYYNFFFIKDNSINLLEIILALLTLSIILTSYYYNKLNNVLYWEYPILILFSLTSIYFLISSNEIISFYFLLEFQSICFYILASYNRKSKKSLESGIKYFILGSFSSILLILGFSFIYGISGLTHLEDLYIYFNTTTLNTLYINLGLILILAAFMFKIYAAPFHFWVSEVYHGAPTSSVMFFATIPLIAFFIVLYKFYFIFFINYNIIWKFFLTLICMCSLLFGTLGALYQQYIKKLLAYSSIMNMGFTTAAIITVNTMTTVHNINYIILYIINTLAVLMIFSNLYDLKKKQNIEILSSFTGFFKQNKFLSFIIMCMFYTLAGLPPFSFFFAKISILTSLIPTSNYWIVFPIIVSTLIGSFYYLRVVQLMSYSTQTKWLWIKPVSYTTLFICISLFLFNLLYLSNSSIVNAISYYIALELYL